MSKSLIHYFSGTLDYPHNLTPLVPPRNKKSNMLDFLLYQISHFFIFRKIVGWSFSNFYGRYHAGQFEEHLLGRDD